MVSPLSLCLLLAHELICAILCKRLANGVVVLLLGIIQSFARSIEALLGFDDFLLESDGSTGIRWHLGERLHQSIVARDHSVVLGTLDLRHRVLFVEGLLDDGGVAHDRILAGEMRSQSLF